MAGPFIKLLPAQDAELYDELHDLIYVCGGRGSGKSEVDYLQLFYRSDRCVDQPYGLFANTEAQLQTFIALITEKLDAIGLAHVFETTAPKSWRKRWRRDGIKVPPRRLRNQKMWIWEDGTHVFCASIINNAYARAKSLDLAFALIEEGTEPGVTRNAIRTILGCVRCGIAKRDGGEGGSECMRRGHRHQTIVKFNVPLNNPGHWIYRDVEELQAREEQRKVDGKKPFFRLITSSTFDNPHTGEEYIDRLGAALDADTFHEQTSGQLKRNTALTSYHEFSPANVLPSVPYDPLRPLHLWFDFNATPATAGMGHDLRVDEVPVDDVRAGNLYIGVFGEFFSGADTIVTEQVANALLEDPTRDARCRDCGDSLTEHVDMGPRGHLCRKCSVSIDGKFCSGVPLRYELSKKYLRTPPNWRGLINHRGPIFVYGDATGRATHADSQGPGGSIQVLRDVFNANLEGRVFFRFKDANPPVNLRVLAVNRMLRNRQGVHSIFFAEWVRAHIDDMREVVPDPKTGQPLKVSKSEKNRNKDDYWMRTDISDALGYMVDYRVPAVLPRASSTSAGVGEERKPAGPMDVRWPDPHAA